MDKPIDTNGCANLRQYTKRDLPDSKTVSASSTLASPAKKIQVPQAIAALFCISKLLIFI
jgi:hypothetical protein